MTGQDEHTSTVPLAELETATHIAAELVRRYGDAYWPFFERLERELTDRKSRRKRLTRFTARK
ncbi:MAG: hypothetical protein Hens3KO_13220 [Henriciella sp.]